MRKNLICLAAMAVLTMCSCGNSNSTAIGGNGSGKYTGPVKTIVIDGGGDIGNFNTTPIMKKSEVNPFPYNTLETLCKEWQKDHPQYKVQINKTSSNGDRSTLVPQLNQRTAPDITYQNGSVLATDLGKDYYVELNEYFEKPNPYIEGNKRWADIYNKEEHAQTMQSDGKYYTVCLEKIPVGIMYNKNILKDAGVDVPTTYTEFIDAMKKVKALGNGIEAYSTTYTWYNIVLEASMFSDLLKEGDTLRQNGMIDTEELCRLYDKKLWDPTLNAIGSGATLENNKYYEYIKLCSEVGKYKAPLTFDAHGGFAGGKLAFLEVTGREIRKLSVNKNINFDWAVMPFPDLTKEDSSNAQIPSIRGTAGLATAWFVTTSAVDKGTVDGVIDLLMFLTAPQNNNKLIGDLKGGIPLNPTSDFEIADYLKPLVDVYQKDLVEVKDNKRSYWGCVNSWQVLGYDYNTAFIKTLQDVDNKIKTPEEAAKYLAQIIKNTVAAKMITENYDKTKW